MTIDISNNAARVNYTVAQGATQTSFSVPFEFFNDADLSVYVDDVLKTITTHYTVSGGDGSTGTITMSVTGASGGSTVVISRSIAIERTSDFVTGVDINRAALNTQLDTLTAIAADNKDKASRSISAPNSEVNPQLELPDADTRKGKLVGFNEATGNVELSASIADGNTLASISGDIATLADIEDGTDATDAIQTVAGVSSNVTTVAGSIASVNTNATNIASINTNASNIADIQNASANAASALSSKNAAATSETSAATSESNAATSATNSANSATASETSRVASVAAQAAAETAETNAETAETNAAASASAASTSASNASINETNAASSASTATTQAGIATTKAGESAASATASANSATASEAAKDAALAALDNFDDRYLGAKASDPTLDNDGNALISGALYFNTTDDVMKVYEGSQWVAAYASLSGALLVNNNLSDVADAAASRTSLGLGTGNTPTFAGLNANGTITSDGLTVDGNFQLNGDVTITDTSGDPFLKLETGQQSYVLRIDNDASDIFQVRDVTNSANRLSIAGTGDISFYEDTGTTPKFFWDASAESLGIGKTDRSTASTFTVQNVNDTTTNTAEFYNDNGNRTFRFAQDTSGNADLLLEKNDGTDTVLISTHGDSYFNGGNVGIGTSSPASILQVRASNPDVYITSDNTGQSDIYFGGTTSPTKGRIQYSDNSDLMAFWTNSSEAMRIDSSGNLLVGTTDAGLYNNSDGSEGVRIAEDHVSIASDARTVFYVNRQTSDGEIINIRKDGSTVGSIGTAGGDPYFAGTTKAIRIGSGGVYPTSNSGSLSDGTYDLGAGSARFKDLHLSGTANAANFNTTSDATLKTNVETLSGSLDAVTSLRGVSFDWLESGGSEIGVIAQEVEAVLPDVVSTNDEGIKSVKYGNMVAVLIEAIKEQQLRIEALEAKLGE